MENAALVGLSRQVALRRELDVVANNLANLGTAGFKSQEVVFREYLMPIARAESFPRGQDRRLSYVEDRATWQDFSTGPIKLGGNQFDVAIDGEGFFAIQTPSGVRYTRNGQFQLNAQGTLVTNEGHPVLSTSGPIQFAEEESDVTIGADGTVSTVQGGARGRLALFKFDNPQSLIPESSTMFRANGIAQDVAAGEMRVVQYASEQSNVQPIRETTRLIEVTRSYEMLAQMMRRSDELRRTAVERLGEVPA